ncbi:MAG: YpdA family putative bacillithiol disulfide reductase [Ignavibacteriaceae bacterium]|nr:YpdA family putative bacillithiol disulfide reductase [Ignavibacteriaceae bacterium]
MPKLYDVLIVGAGPIGISCGIEAVKNKISHCIIEKGCLVNSIFNYPTNMTFFSTSDRLEIGDVPFVSHSDKPTRREALEYFRRVTNSWKLNVNTFETVNKIERHDGLFTVTTNKQKYLVKFVIIATGYYDNPNLLNVPGEELPKVKHYFDEAHPYVYKNVLVVGGGNSAVDVALETFRKGSEVTMVVKEKSLKEGVKYWVRPDIENRIKEGTIKAFFKSEILKIEEENVEIKTPDEIISLPNDFVFAMTGYHSDFNLLKSFGVSLTNDDQMIPIYNADTLESNIKNLFLAGVVLCGMETSKWFIENSRDHALKIFEVIKKR